MNGPGLVTPLRGTSLRTIGRSLLGSAVGATVSSLVALLLLPLVLGRLSLAAYGVWATVSALTAIGALADGGVSVEIVRRVAAANGRDDRPAMQRAVDDGTTALAWLAGGVLLAGALAAGTLPGLLFPGLEAGLASQVPGLILAVTGLLAVELFLAGRFAALRGVQRGDAQSYATTAGVLVGLTVTAGLVVTPLGLWALPLGQAAGTVTGALLQERALRRILPWLRPRLRRTSRQALSAYAGLSSVVVLASIANLVDSQVDKLVLGHVLGASAAGSYQVGSALAIQSRAIALLPTALLLAGTAELAGGLRLKQLFRAVTELNAALAGLLLGGVLLFAPPFVTLWLGPDFTQSARAAQLLAVALLLNAWTAPVWVYAVGAGRYRPALAGALANVALNAGLSWPLTVLIGFDGALYGSLAGNAAGLLAIWLTTRDLPVAAWLRPTVLSTGLLAVVALPVVWLQQRWVVGWPQLLVLGALWVGGGAAALVLAGRLPLALHLRGPAPFVRLRERV